MNDDDPASTTTTLVDELNHDTKCVMVSFISWSVHSIRVLVANAFRMILPIRSLGTVVIQLHLVDSPISFEGRFKRTENQS